MKIKTFLSSLLILPMLLCGCGETLSSQPTASPTQNPIGGTLMEQYLNNLSSFPFSFIYDGKEYHGFGDEFSELSRKILPTDIGADITLTLLHKESNTRFTVSAKTYQGYDAYDWTVSLTNVGDTDTKVFSDLRAEYDFTGANAYLKGINGDTLSADLYSPYSLDLFNRTITKENTSGRPTHHNFPYFNLQYENGGCFIAVGWPGCWKAQFKNSQNTTHFTAGQRSISAYLKPGETIRTPLMAFVPYENKTEAEAMNLWRRWFINCNMRKIEGKNFAPAFAASTMSQGANTKSMLRYIQQYIDHDIQLDYFWMDAGWYTDENGNTIDWPQTGSLTVNKKLFPNAFADITAAMEAQGGKTLLWFEPEIVRLNKESFLKSFPDFNEQWMLGAITPGTWLEGQLLDLGNANCRAWLLAKIIPILKEGGISMYRQDFNGDPAPVWQQNDGKNRNGATENSYVQGYLAFWDAILEHFPNMMIDSCASGGGRNDLETMRRSVPLHISDIWDGNTGGMNERQIAMQSLAQWIPYFKLEKNTNIPNTLYNFRSCYAPWINANLPLTRRPADWALITQVRQEWETISQYFYADYYQLTEWSKSSAAWHGWEFFDPQKQEGYGQLFRPSDCTVAQQNIVLYGLDTDKHYRITDFDGNFDFTESGAILTEKGFSVSLPQDGSCSVFTIHAAH